MLYNFRAIDREVVRIGVEFDGEMVAVDGQEDQGMIEGFGAQKMGVADALGGKDVSDGGLTKEFERVIGAKVGLEIGQFDGAEMVPGLVVRGKEGEMGETIELLE